MIRTPKPADAANIGTASNSGSTPPPNARHLEVVDPPPPTPLMLPARVLAAMAVELPRDALQSLADDSVSDAAQAIDDDAVYEAGDDDDDEVTLHGAKLFTSQALRYPIPEPAHPGGRELTPMPATDVELSGLEGEISSFRLRKQPPPPAPGQELDALFGSAGRNSAPPSRNGVFGSSGFGAGAKSAPPPPPSKKLNVFASRMVFEPNSLSNDVPSIPSPVSFAEPTDTGYPNSGYANGSYAHSPYSSQSHSGQSHSGQSHSGQSHSGQSHPGHSQPPHSYSAHSEHSDPRLSDPAGALRAQRAEDFEEETETQILIRSDVPEAIDFGRRPSPSQSAYSTTIAPHRLQMSPTQPPRKRAHWLALAGGGLFGGAALAFAAFHLFSPPKGELIVDVANQQCNVMNDVNVYVDDELVCTTTPCRLEAAARSHVIFAVAAGYPKTAAEAVVVETGSVTLHKLQLGATSETGVDVRSRQTGLALYVDGAHVGDLPQRVLGLAPGDHTLLVTGGERFYAEERKVRVEENQVVALDSIDLKLKTGTLLVRSSEALTDARVLLDDKPIELPFQQQLDAGRRYKLTATKSGFEPYESWVTFDSRTPEQQVDIQLVSKRDAARGTTRVASSGGAAGGGNGGSSRASRSTGERATLNLNSKPVSMVLLDGVPIGQTPRVGVSVSPGPHSIVFVNPGKGRKRMSATVAAGASKNVSVRF